MTIALFFILACNLFAQPLHTSGREYPLPLPELEKTIIPWLRNAGYKVASLPINMGQVRITAEKDDTSFDIILMPHSPLAAEILVADNTARMVEKSQLDGLWDHLNAYVDSIGTAAGVDNDRIPAGIKTLDQTIVCIRARLNEDEIQVSGFLADKHGLVITTAHNLTEFQSIKVILKDGQEFDAILVKSNPDKDLALLHINHVPLSFISLLNGRDDLDSGESIFSISCMNKFSGTVHSGTINGPPVSVDNQVFWKMSMKTLHGSSGSPVVDRDGNLVGVVKGRYRGSDSIGFMIPFATIIEFLNGI